MSSGTAWRSHGAPKTTTHSNDKYRRVIYRCNKKYGKGCKCKTPHITEDEIKEMFIKAANELFSEKDEIIENTKTMIEEKIQKFDYKRSDSSVTIGLDGFDFLYCRNMT
ncbi:recombinase zinc beta ribbon domain-containing protein [Lachnospiraceae bacterium HCP1S3_C3]